MATPGKGLSEQDRKRMEDLHKHGLSIRQIAHEQRVSTTTVQKIIRNIVDK